MPIWNWPGRSGEEFWKSSMLFHYVASGHYLLWIKGITLYLNKLKPLTQVCFMPSLVQIGIGVLEKKIFKIKIIRHSIFTMLLNVIPPKKRACIFIFPSPKNVICQDLFKWPVILEKIFNSCQCNFILLLYSPLRKGRNLSFELFESPPPKNVCPKINWKLPSGFGEDIKKSSIYFHLWLCHYYLPLIKGLALL